MKNMKFWVNSPEHSEDIQRELFRLGFAWYAGQFIQYTNEPFLSAHHCRISAYRNQEVVYFNSLRATETTLEELKAM